MRAAKALGSTCLVVVLAAFGGKVEAAPVLSGAVPQAIAVADFNADGRADLAVANAFDDTVAVHQDKLA